MKNDILFEDAAAVLKAVDLSSLDGASIFITGATGLIGTHLLASLCLLKESGCDVDVLGQYHSEPADFTQEIVRRGGFHLTQEARPQARDVVIHASGYGQPTLFTRNPAETIRLNAEVTGRLLRTLPADGKFLFISSVEVYSGLEKDFASESDIGMTTPHHPRACYIEGKRCGEAIVNAYSRAGVDARSARLATAYGPGTRKNDLRAMNQFIRQALVEKHIDMKFPGHDARTFCYISDAIAMLWKILLNGTREVYNVGGRTFTNMADVAKEISEITGAGLTLPAESPEMTGAPHAVHLDISRYENEFGRKDFVYLDKGLERTIEWQKGLYEF